MTSRIPLAFVLFSFCSCGGGSSSSSGSQSNPPITEGTQQLNTPSMHFLEDGRTFSDPRGGTRVAVPVRFVGPVSADGTVSFQVSGSAVAGKHFEMLSRSPVRVPEGAASVDVELRLLDPGEWFRERSIVLHLSASTEIDLGGETEVHAWTRSIDDPPTVRWESIAWSGDSASVHSIPVVQSQRSGEDTTVHYTLGGTAVEGVDYAIVPGSQSGALLIPAGETSADVQLVIHPGADGSGRTIELALDHELDDRSNRNLYYNTHDWRLDVEDPRFPGEPYSSHVAGGNTTWKQGAPEDVVAEERGVDVIPQAAAVPKTAWDGHELQGVVQSEWLGMFSTAYVRLSFEGAARAGLDTPSPVVREYTRLSVYVDTFGEPEEWRNSRFVRLTLRNRGKDIEHAVMFDRGAVTGRNADNEPMDEVTTTDTGVWGIWKDKNWHPEDSAGVVEETIGGKHYTRLWYVHVSDSTFGYLDKQGSLVTDDVGVDAMNALFRFTYARKNDSSNGQSDSWDLSSVGGSVAGLGLLGFHPMYESSATELSGPPGPFWERRGNFWEPRGNATRRAQEPTLHAATFTIE